MTSSETLRHLTNFPFPQRHALCRAAITKNMHAINHDNPVECEKAETTLVGTGGYSYMPTSGAVTCSLVIHKHYESGHFGIIKYLEFRYYQI